MYLDAKTDAEDLEGTWLVLWSVNGDKPRHTKIYLGDGFTDSWHTYKFDISVQLEKSDPDLVIFKNVSSLHF